MIRIAALLCLMAAPAAAQNTNCLNRDMLAGYLASEGMPLYSWGLNSEGHMEELFLGEGGDWAVVVTAPSGCARLASRPDRLRGRLWSPAPGNKLFGPPFRPESRRMVPGRDM
jgi:hypothetical protein